MTYNKKTVEDAAVAGKKVLVRCDFNVPVKDGVITDDKRIAGAMKTVQYLVDQGAKVILCSHMGRPHNVLDEKLSLDKKEKKKIEELPASEQEAAKVVREEAKAELKSRENEVDGLLKEINAQEDQLEAAHKKLEAAAYAMDAEIKRKQEQYAAQSRKIVSEAGFIWPSYCTIITSLFGSRVHPVTGRANNHTGIDIAAAGGTNILAAKSGVVITSTYNSSYGNYVVVDHGNGQTTLYAHMRKRLVSEGQTVKQGSTLGLVGTTGSSTGNHLHFEIRVNGARKDPLNYFKNSTFTLRSGGKSVSYTVK